MTLILMQLCCDILDLLNSIILSKNRPKDFFHFLQEGEGKWVTFKCDSLHFSFLKFTAALKAFFKM